MQSDQMHIAIKFLLHCNCKSRDISVRSRRPVEPKRDRLCSDATRPDLRGERSIWICCHRARRGLEMLLARWCINQPDAYMLIARSSQKHCIKEHNAEARTRKIICRPHASVLCDDNVSQRMIA